MSEPAIKTHMTVEDQAKSIIEKSSAGLDDSQVIKMKSHLDGKLGHNNSNSNSNLINLLIYIFVESI